MQPLSGNQRPDLLTALMNMSLVLRLPRKMHLCRSSSHVPRLPTFLEMLQNPHVLLTFDKVHNPLRLPRETTSERPKVLRRWVFFFCFFTSKCASRHNGVHFFDISTSKSAPNVSFFCFFTCTCSSRHNGVHFFRHLNFQKWSEYEVFCTFWLGNVLHATSAHTFSTSQLRKELQRRFDVLCTFSLGNVLRATTACYFSSLIWPHGSAPAALARPSGATNRWKNTVCRDCPTFSHLHLLSSETFSFLIFFLLRFSLFWSSFFFLLSSFFFLLSSALLCSALLFSSLLFSSLTLPISAFHLSILSEVWLLNFLRWYIIQDI